MFQGTTILAVKIGDKVAVAGDGQVTFGNNIIIKHSKALRIKSFSIDNRRDIPLAKIIQRIQITALVPKGRMLNRS